MNGKFAAELVNLRLSIVIRRPCTLILLLARCTKRLRRWKNWARLSNFPPKVKVSGTVSRPGTGWPGVTAAAAAAAVEPPPTGSPPDFVDVEVEVSPALRPLCWTA